MGWTNETPNENLPQFVDSDKPTWRGDINYAMSKIDSALAARVREEDFTNIVGVSVLNHGAMGDGITNDTLAIQAALDDAANSIGVVVVPQGVYLFDSTLTIPAGVQMVGPGTPPSDVSVGAMLVYTGGSGVAVQGGGTRWGMSNLALLYNDAAFTGTLLSCSGGTGVDSRAFATFDNVWFGASPTYQAVYSPNVLVDLHAAQNVTFNGCMFYGGKTLVRGIDDANALNPWSKIVEFNQCTFNRYNNEAVLNAGESWLFSSCVFEPTQDKYGRALRQTVAGVGVTFLSPWLGDNTESAAWIDWLGRGLNIIGARSYVIGSLVRLSGVQADASIIGCNALCAGSSDAVVDATAAPASSNVTILSTNPGGNGRMFTDDVKPRRRVVQGDYTNARFDVGEITLTNGSSSSPSVSFSNPSDGLYYDSVNRRVVTVSNGVNAVMIDGTTTRIQNELRHSGLTAGFFGRAPIAQPSLPPNDDPTLPNQLRAALITLGLAKAV